MTVPSISSVDRTSSATTSTRHGRSEPVAGARTAAGTPATRAGHCECCATPYSAGTPIVWDRVVAGWVLPTHRSAGTRPAPPPRGMPTLF